MKRLLWLLLFIPAIGNAQNKPYLEVGGVGGYFPKFGQAKDGKFAYGANIGLTADVNQFLKLGVGFMPLWIEDVKKPLLPVFGDFRIRLDKRAALLLQPGYNFYKTSASATAGNATVKSETKGGFYGGAGVSFDIPVSPNTAVYIQGKYNYFGFQGNTTLRVNNNTTTSTSSKSHNEAVTLGVGLRLQ